MGDCPGRGGARAEVRETEEESEGGRRSNLQLEGSERQEEEGCLVKWVARREAG